MKLRYILVLLASLAVSACANGIRDIEIAKTTGAASVTGTAACADGWIEAVQHDVASGMTTDVAVAVVPKDSSMAAYTALSLSAADADAWYFPTNTMPRRIAVKTTDTLRAIWSSSTTNKAVRVVIRVETTNEQRP